MNNKTKHRIAVLSDGAWGSAIALLLAKNSHELSLWGPFPDNICEIRKFRENRRFLSGVEFPPEIRLFEDMREAVEGAEIVVLASPSQYMRKTLEAFRAYHRKEQILVNLAKGIETKSLLRMSELCSLFLGECRYVVLSGPSHAEEVSRGVPTAVVAASDKSGLVKKVQEIFMNERFRIYGSSDPIGVELGGALKNVFAIAAGIIDGMGLGDNSKAALFTRGVAEMSRLGAKLGGDPRSFAGLSGVGDMIVTCYSKFSRNRHVGEELGKGRKIEDIRKEMGLVVAEGVATSESAWRLAKRKRVETPLINEVRSIIYEEKNPRKALLDLMTRKPKMEFK